MVLPPPRAASLCVSSAGSNALIERLPSIGPPTRAIPACTICVAWGSASFPRVRHTANKPCDTSHFHLCIPHHPFLGFRVLEGPQQPVSTANCPSPFASCQTNLELDPTPAPHLTPALPALKDGGPSPPRPIGLAVRCVHLPLIQTRLSSHPEPFVDRDFPSRDEG